MSNMIGYRLCSIVALVGVLALAGCGGGGGGLPGVYSGDVEVDNQTDLTGTWENLYSFELAPAATQFWTGNLLSDIVYPGEVAFVGTFDEDSYDAEAQLEYGLVPFFDVFVPGGRTTTFQVY
jgi:hypothetical protein